MKKILFGLLLVAGFAARSQVYNNEWIDYAKSYYKFKVGKTGLYRLSQSVLSGAGLGAVPAQQFQLWRNGVQLPLYTSVATGVLAATDYIEFWGLMNDGKPDNELYRDPSYQLNAKWSLETDTAAYFLTVNATGTNLRLQTTANNVAGNTLPAEPYFMYTLGQYFRERLNGGPADVIGSDYLFSSAYEQGEGWSSNEITTNYSGGFSYGVQSLTFNNLAVYNGTGAPRPQFKIAVSGTAPNDRRFKAEINTDSITGNLISQFDAVNSTTLFSLSTLSSNTATVKISNLNTVAAPNYSTDRITVHQYEITYPRQFDFGGASNFEFTLPLSAAGSYLRITNFAGGTAIPVLYDLTNGRRYEANTSAASVLQFVLQPSATERSMVLVAEDAANITAVTSLQQRSFKNYTAAAAQGNYLIISHPALFNGTGGANPVEQYRQYRASAAGGSYTAQIYESDELIDQFGFGIKKNPAGIRNFIAYARSKYATVPKQVFIIGHGMNYINQRYSESGVDAEKINLIPTFGYPSSDNLLGAPKGSSAIGTPIGRLSVFTPQEVEVYLKKIKDYEQAQATPSGAIRDRAWMKNVVHIAGVAEQGLGDDVNRYMDSYGRIIKDTVFGAKVSTFRKISNAGVEQINDLEVPRLFAEGISLMTYFGHSSTTTLEFNLDKPENYNNYKKYPLFIGLGCLVGDYFNYTYNRTLPEIYVLAPDRGMIGFISSTNYGVVSALDTWSTAAYKEMAYKSYGKTVGEMMQATSNDIYALYNQNVPYYGRLNIEQLSLHGDPALKINYTAKPDYVVEDSLVKVTPDFVSIADSTIKITAKFLNIGLAPEKNVVVRITRQYPNGTNEVVYTTSVFKRPAAGQPADKYADSISLTVPVRGLQAKGVNTFVIAIDPDNAIDEAFENNNTVTKKVTVFEDEARPVYPYNYSIVSKQSSKVMASTANSLAVTRQYRMEMDTTELFNSPLKVSKTLTSGGGLLEFDPGITYRDSTVYYWRTSPVLDGGQLAWSNASFIYLAGSSDGFNQSHFYQHTKSAYERMHLDTAARQLVYNDIYHNIFLQTGVYPYPSNQGQFYGVTLDGIKTFGPGCAYNEIIFNVLDPVTFLPWVNNGGAGGQYGSSGNCGGGFVRETNFNFPLGTASGRKLAMDFLDLVPAGYYVIVRNNPNGAVSANTYAATWQADTSLYGSGNSLYHRLKSQGFADVDSLYEPKAFGLAFKKNGQNVFRSSWIFTKSIYESATLDVGLPGKDSVGFVTSPAFGPARSWKQLKWRGSSLETPGSDVVTVDIIGVSATGTETTLISGLTTAQQDYDVSGISATQYPYLKLKLRSADKVNATPWQLRYWRLLYVPVPEGAIAPNLYFKIKDTVAVGETSVDVAVAFKNISDYRFDSLKVRMYVRDKNNVVRTTITRLKPLDAADTVHADYKIDIRTLTGPNTLYIEFNPDDDQPEQQHFNNFLFKDFFVVADTVKPLLDVTFDNVHILNRDIVAAKPNILIKLKDNSGFLLTDQSTIKVQVKYPDGSLHPFAFDNNILKFNAAQGTDNTATVEFRPAFAVDGDYELVVSGKDMSGNEAGAIDYRIGFQVINKPMISNMLNYPNPFTTSTAFVFTLTGSEVPQNIRIQILTVTGKVVREITKQELGNLRIGRNITDFKWDGTDQYGQKLANGVYLYRVITNLNGKSLDKYTSTADKTDQYFNKGYGKMYLMR